MLNKIKNLLKREPSNEQLAIGTISQALNVTESHLIALCRLLFIKPEVLVREANNVKGNAEYLLKMIEAKKGGEK